MNEAGFSSDSQADTTETMMAQRARSINRSRAMPDDSCVGLNSWIVSSIRVNRYDRLTSHVLIVEERSVCKERWCWGVVCHDPQMFATEVR